jgi:hypothetical protein
MNLSGRRAELIQFAGPELIVINVRAPQISAASNWYLQFLWQAQYLGAEHFAPFDFDFSAQCETLGFAALIPLLDYLKWTKAAVAVGAVARGSSTPVKVGSFGRTKLISDGFDFYWLKPQA